jgi:hypothetical protein
MVESADLQNAPRFSPMAALSMVSAATATILYFLPSPSLVLIFCVLSYAAVLTYDLRLFGLADYRTLILVPSGLYAFTGPIWVIVLGHEEDFSVDLMARSALCTVIYILVFALVSGLCSRPEARTFRAPARMKLLWITIGAAFFVYQFYILRGALDSGGQSRAEQISGGSALIGILTYAVFTGIVALFAALQDDIRALLLDRGGVSSRQVVGTGQLSTYLPVVAALAMAATVIISQVVLAGNRREVLGFMAALFLVIKPPRLPLWLIAIAAVTAVFAFYLPWLRESPVSQWFDLLINFQSYFGSVELSNSEFMPFSMIAYIMFAAERVQDAPTYLDALGTFIPKLIWENRPEPAGQWFVASYFPEIYNAGGGLAFNAVVESILNFGYAGIVIAPALLALMLEAVNRLLSNLRLGAAGIIIASTFLMRQDFATTLKGGVIVIALMFMWAKIAGQISNQSIESQI